MPKVNVNGAYLNYEEVGAGAPLLFLACTIDDSAEKWVDHMERYASGYRVIVPDVRGLAGNARVEDAEPSEWVADTAALLDALGTGPLPVVAETLGSRIGARLAVDHPGKVSALVLNGLIARSNPEGDAWRRQMFMPGTAKPENIERMRMFQGDTWAEAAEFYVNMHEKKAFRDYFDIPSIAGEIKAPTLITRGDIDDAAHPIEHSTAVHAGVADSWLSISPDTGFNVMTSHPEEFWALVGRFLSETG